MDIIEFLSHPIIKKCIDDNNLNLIEKDKVRFNLFTLSNSTSYLENFHSDVIAELLKPNGHHHEGNVFLIKFIQYLNEHYSLNINPDEFQNSKIHREIGNSESHIDIIILDSKSKKSIIIENKINNAPDMKDQIDRYYKITTYDWKYDVKGIVYLTLDSIKQAPPVVDKAKPLVRSIGAFTNKSNDLVNGWLIPCYKISKNIDNQSLINQYIKLIKHLAFRTMDSKIMDEFYKFVNQNNGLDTTASIIELTKTIPEYRANKLVSAIKDYSPFKKYYNYQANYKLYENYIEGNNSFKLDVWFNSDGSAGVYFWNPAKPNEEGAKIVYDKLVSVGFDKEFKQRKDFGYVIYFELSETQKSLEDIDNLVLLFIKNFMERLRT